MQALTDSAPAQKADLHHQTMDTCQIQALGYCHWRIAF